LQRASSIGWSAGLRLRSGAPLRSQAVRGDAAALTAIYERHHQALYRYCRSILRDDEEARDALQSTMAKALTALRDEQRDFELRPWLFRIAHNEAISRVRRRREVADPDAVAAASTDSLAQDVEDRERLAHLRADLRDLPERQRAALVLRELSGLSHEEIASVLDSTARAVKQTIFEARVALQECAEGRAMPCADVQRALSDGDGRVLRGRRMRAHVRACRACRQFKAALAQRKADLAVLAPALPASAGAALLGHLLPGAKASLASGAGTATGVSGGLAGTVATKAAIVVAATATLAGTTTTVRSVVERSHGSRPAPTHVAPARHRSAAPATAAPTTGAGAHPSPPLHARAPAPTHRSTPSHATGAPARQAAGTSHATKAQHGHGQQLGKSHAAGSTGRGNSQSAPGHTKQGKPAKPSKAAKAQPTRAVHSPAAGRHAGSSPAAASAHHGAATPAVPAPAAAAGGAAADSVTPPGHGAASSAPAGKQQAGAHSP
jgi:RNA polymerase sigma factor (sigma-70 family)